MPVSELKANPLNWRTHGVLQHAALAGSLEVIGQVQSVVYNRRSGLLVDGQFRLAIAVENNITEISVTVVDLEPDEERIVLASLDPIGAMAGCDIGKFEHLICGLSCSNQDLQKMLEMPAGYDEEIPSPDLADGDIEETGGMSKITIFVTDEDKLDFVRHLRELCSRYPNCQVLK